MIKKFFLCVFTRNNVLIDMHSYWSFDYLQDRLFNKMKYLAFVEADSKTINGIEYYRYTDMFFYKLKDFNTFINLIKIGKIIVTFKIDIYKSGNRCGKIHDHGTGFSISRDDLSLLYEQIY